MTNVLVLMGDEHQARALGCAGHPTVQTPNLDALAARGTRFTSCWTPSPICVPARASFATGQWIHEIDAWDSVQAYAGEPRGWPHLLRDDGWEVTSIGKLHHRSAADDDGFSERIHPMFIAGGTGWTQGLPRRDPLPYPEAFELAADTGVGETAYTHYDRRITDAAVDWISRRSTDRPWAGFVSWIAPHYPLSAPEEFTELYPLAEVPPPEIDVIDPTHDAVRAMRDFFDYGAGFETAERVREGRRAYFGLCSFLDHNVGRVLSALDETGQLDDTLIIYTSDHGELLGNRGLWCKSFLYEDSVAVPMIVAGPGMPEGSTCATATNLVDVAPTIAEAAGMRWPGGGQALTALAHAPVDPDRIAFSEYHDGGSITGSFAVRAGRWKYVHHVDHPPELYDVADDPNELLDLGTVSATTVERRTMHELLRSIVDPDDANERAFASQQRLIESFGGRAAIETGFRFNHTPAP